MLTQLIVFSQQAGVHSITFTNILCNPNYVGENNQEGSDYRVTEFDIVSGLSCSKYSKLHFT